MQKSRGGGARSQSQHFNKVIPGERGFEKPCTPASRRTRLAINPISPGAWRGQLKPVWH